MFKVKCPRSDAPSHMSQVRHLKSDGACLELWEGLKPVEETRTKTRMHSLCDLHQRQRLQTLHVLHRRPADDRSIEAPFDNIKLFKNLFSEGQLFVT